MCPAFLKFFIKMDSIVICVPCMLEHVSYELRFFKKLQIWEISYVNPIQYGLFLKHYCMGEAIIITLLFLKVEGQNLVASGILSCFLQKWH